MTASTGASRAGSSSGSGTRYGMPAAAILCLAWVMRAAIVGTGTRNSRAISTVDRRARAGQEPPSSPPNGRISTVPDGSALANSSASSRSRADTR
jgi:hypothetical protein